MNQNARVFLKKQLSLVKNAPQHVTFSQNKDTPVMLVAKAKAISPQLFPGRVALELKETFESGTIYVGTIIRGKQGFEIVLKRSLCKGPIDARQALRTLQLIAKKIQVVELGTATLAFAEDLAKKPAGPEQEKDKPEVKAAPAGPLHAKGPDPAPVLEAWKKARESAMQQLNLLRAALQTSGDPEMAKAVALVRAIQSNLTAEPTTLRQVLDLERYISRDDVVAEAETANGFGLQVRLREPLLAALAPLRAVYSHRP